MLNLSTVRNARSSSSGGGREGPRAIVSFHILLALFLILSPNLLLAQQLNSNTESSPAAGLSTIALGDEKLATTTTAESIAKSSTTEAATTVATAEAVTTEADSEPVTSTLDELSINSDETATSKAFPAAESGEEEGSDTAAAAGIEPKSISRGNGEVEESNGLTGGDTNNEEKANLSIESGEQTAGSGSGSSSRGADKTTSSAVPLASQVNMTQIDNIYVEGRMDAEATANSWRRMSKKLKKGIANIIGSVVPMALNMSQEAKISSNCSGAMLKWVLSMNQLKSWALRMLDASGKPVAGLLEGSMTMFGNYRQCLKIRAPDDDEIEFTGSFKEYFRGKYCIIQAKPWLPEKSRFYNLNAKLDALMAKNDEDDSDSSGQWYDKTVLDELSEWALAFNFINIRFDLCIPSLCRREDIQKAVNYLLKGLDIKARVLRCEMDHIETSGYLAAANVETGSPEVAEALAAASTVRTDVTSTQLGGGSSLFKIGNYSMESFSQLGWLLIPLIATILVLIATGLSLTIGTNNGGSEKITSSKLGHTIQSFSLRNSVSSHLNVDYDQLADDKPLSLYGVRFLLVLWVILVESAVNLKFDYLRELMMLKDLIFCWPMQFIINSTLQYDSFILLTAFTMGYKNCLNDGINQGKAITRFVLDKYVRLMPSIMLMVALVILMPLIYRGPVWNDYVTTQSAVCQSTGWLNSIFLQNYLPYNQICLPQTWLLCVEFQLILMMAPIVYYLNKSYTANFGGNQISGKILDKNAKSSSASTSGRRNDSSKMFFWLWTMPGAILVACIVASLLISFYNVYYRELPPAWFYTMADPDSKALYFGEHMTKVWTHLAVFAIGILAGIECRRASKNVLRGYKGSNIDFTYNNNNINNNNNNSLSRQHHNSQSSSVSSLPIILTQNGTTRKGSDFNNWQSSISIDISQNSSNSMMRNHLTRDGNVNDNNNHCKRGLCSILLNIIVSLIAITTMSLIIFSPHDWSLNDFPKPYVAGLFDAGSRFLWSLAMIWLLYMISVPNKDRSFSILARSLGHPLMVCLGKLSFLIYIIHPFVHIAVLAIQEQPIYSSWLMLFHIIIGNITITVILASLVSLFVEMPCRNLFRRCGTSLLLTQSDIIVTSRDTTGNVNGIASSGGCSGGSSTTSTSAATTPTNNNCT